MVYVLINEHTVHRVCGVCQGLVQYKFRIKIVTTKEESLRQFNGWYHIPIISDAGFISFIDALLFTTFNVSFHAVTTFFFHLWREYQKVGFCTYAQIPFPVLSRKTQTIHLNASSYHWASIIL